MRVEIIKRKQFYNRLLENGCYNGENKMATNTTLEYRLIQKIKIANGQDKTEYVGQGFGDNEGVARLLKLRDKYRENGFDVDLVKTKRVITTEIIEL